MTRIGARAALVALSLALGVGCAVVVAPDFDTVRVAVHRRIGGE